MFEVTINPNTPIHLRQKAEAILSEHSPKADGSYWVDQEDSMSLMLKIGDAFVETNFKPTRREQ